MSAVAVQTATKSIDESRAEIYSLLGAEGQGGGVWDSLDTADKKAFCVVAGIQVTDLSRPLCKINQFDRRKLFMAIKSIEQVTKKFASVSFPDFK